MTSAFANLRAAPMVELPRSARPAPEGATSLGAPAPDTQIHLTIVLKPSTPLDPAAGILTREEYARAHACDPAMIEGLTSYAKAHGLKVVDADPVTHIVRLQGTVAQAEAAFRPGALGRYARDGREFIARSGSLSVPAPLADHVTAVMGFDQRPVAKPFFIVRPGEAGGKPGAVSAHAGGTSYTPIQIAQHYGFPTNVTGTGQTIALIELGGGYNATQMATYFSGLGVKRTGKLVAVTVDGATNTPSDPNGADGEVQLDIEVAGAVAPGANVAVYFGPNQGNGFLDAISAAVHDTTNNPTVISISWGGPESSWATQDMDAMDQVFAAAATLGIVVTAASGDSGSKDGTSRNVADYPASSPNVLGCGGTSLPKSGAEVAWNDGVQGNGGGGATGGGFSGHFKRPSWQTITAKQTGRGVPDVSGNADPETGYVVSIDGQSTVIGGTSAVAPLYAGLFALIGQASGRKLGLVAKTLYAHSAAFNDITSGNNTGYKAAKGWDPVTGLGSPKGAAIAALFTAPPTV